MKLLLLHPDLHCPTRVTSLIERRLIKLSERIRIEQAEVRLADEPDASPRFRAAILLRVPGPDLHASACDHTLGVVAEKALRAIETQVAARSRRALLRQKLNLPRRAGLGAVRSR